MRQLFLRLFLIACLYFFLETNYYLPSKNAGEMTVNIYNQDAFINPYETLSKQTRENIFYGLSFFRLPWVKAPSSTGFRDGLGPFFDANSCRSCHVLNSKGSAPYHSAKKLGILIKLQDKQTKKGDVFFGKQLSRFASHDLDKEPHVSYVYEKDKSHFFPRLKILSKDQEGSNLLRRSVLSPRLAPHLAGMGLIENISDEDILAHADPKDKNGDGISGRPNRVYSPSLKKRALGKYGWKAGQATLADQSAFAFVMDMGITSKYFPQEDLTAGQKKTLKKSFRGDLEDLEIEDRQFKAVVAYLAYLKVPQQKDINPFKMGRGKRLFEKLACSKCHIDTFKTKATFLKQKNSPLNNQWIYPYSDFLLHDMGEGLADEVVEGESHGHEWRTAPLWGIGLVQVANKRARFLHDGRAATLEEAILWHGGEAKKSSEGFLKLKEKQKKDLLYFVGKL